jgi:hypothetical protein
MAIPEGHGLVTCAGAGDVCTTGLAGGDAGGVGAGGAAGAAMHVGPEATIPDGQVGLPLQVRLSVAYLCPGQQQ